jgi:hypothetical protein
MRRRHGRSGESIVRDGQRDSQCRCIGLT